jgi:hypothetical protein
MIAKTGHPGQDTGIGQSEHDSMDRTAGTGKLGDTSAETDSRERTGGRGQLERIVKTGQLHQDSSGTKGMTGWLEKKDRDSRDRTTKTGQPWQESQDRTARTG